MKGNDWQERLNVAYSTDPDFRYESGAGSILASISQIKASNVLLLADNNNDMRMSLTESLPKEYRVVSVADGKSCAKRNKFQGLNLYTS